MKYLPARLTEDAPDRNLIASYRAHAMWQERGESVEEGGVLVVAGGDGLPGPYKNLVVRLDKALPPAAVVERAKAFFTRRDCSFSVIVRRRYDADLEAWLLESGYSLKSESPCLRVDRPVAVPKPDPRVRIERFANVGHVRDAVAVRAGALGLIGLTVESAHRMLARHERLLDPQVAGFVAYVDGVPSATALTLYSEGAAGVYGVAALPVLRGRSLGELCTALAANAGFERGAKVVTLQASPVGLPVYNRMGFRRCDQLRRYRLS